MVSAALRDGSTGPFGGLVDRWNRLIRSSVLPVAKTTFWAEAVGAGNGARARHRMAEVWALNRNESANETDRVSSSGMFFRSNIFRGIAAVIPCNVLSYDPVMICMWMEDFVSPSLISLAEAGASSWGSLFLFDMVKIWIVYIF